MQHATIKTMRKPRAELKLKSHFTPAGSYIIRTHQAGEIQFTQDEEGKVISVDKESLIEAMHNPLREMAEIENLVVSGSGGYGINIVARALAGAAWTTVYQIAIDSAGIGTGTTTPADTDTDLQTAVLTGVACANVEISGEQIIYSFFIPTATLANGTYTEFAIYCNGRLFARSIISPTYSKGTNEDTTIEYTITLSN